MASDEKVRVTIMAELGGPTKKTKAQLRSAVKKAHSDVSDGQFDKCLNGLRGGGRIITDGNKYKRK